MSVTYHADMLVAVHTAVKDAVNAAGATPYINIRDSSDVLLSTLPLQHPWASVNGTTGQLTALIGARDDEAAASGTAAKAELCDHAGKIWGTWTCSAGSSPVANTCVLASTSIVAGAPVELISFTIG